MYLVSESLGDNEDRPQFFVTQRINLDPEMARLNVEKRQVLLVSYIWWNWNFREIVNLLFWKMWRHMKAGKKITYSILKGLFPLDIGVVDIKKKILGSCQSSCSVM